MITLCQQRGVGSLFISNPDGMRNKYCGRHHDQRMSQWEYGQDLADLFYKATRACIEC